MELTKDGILNTRVVEGVAVISFDRGRMHEEREILLTLESLSRYVMSKKGLKILLDMGNVEYVSSAGLGHLVGLLKKSKTNQGIFKLCCLQPPIQELFDVMRLDRIFEMFRSVEEGVASFEKGKEGVKEAVEA